MRLVCTTAAIVIVATAAIAAASVVVPLSIEQLAGKSTRVVHGKVISKHSSWTRDHHLVTITEIAVAEALKGAADTGVLVRTRGGLADGVGEQVSGEAQFVVGEEVVIFLHPSRVTDGSYSVIGLAQGKFTVTGSTAVQDLSGLGFAEAPGAPVQDRAGEPIGITELKQRIRRAVTP